MPPPPRVPVFRISPPIFTAPITPSTLQQALLAAATRGVVTSAQSANNHLLFVGSATSGGTTGETTGGTTGATVKTGTAGNDFLTGDLGNDRLDGGSGLDGGHGGYEDGRIDWIESLERITACPESL